MCTRTCSALLVCPCLPGNSHFLPTATLQQLPPILCGPLDPMWPCLPSVSVRRATVYNPPPPHTHTSMRQCPKPVRYVVSRLVSGASFW